MAWKATSVDLAFKPLGGNPKNPSKLTEFVTKVFRVDDGRQERVRRVDVLFFHSLGLSSEDWGFGRAYHRASRERMLRKKKKRFSETDRE